MKANILTAAPAALLALALGCTGTDPMEPAAAPTRTAAADSAAPADAAATRRHTR